MSTRGRRYDATVLRGERLSPHLVRIVLGGLGRTGFASTGVPDEWVGLVVPGQFQSRYYTVRRWTGTELILDVALHQHGLVTDWASRDCRGERVTVTEPRGSFAMPREAAWLLLVGDLTALPAMARIVETVRSVPIRVVAEVPDDLTGYLPAATDVEVTWMVPPPNGPSALARMVEELDWPPGDGYFWMAGESAQMRSIRKHLLRVRRMPSGAYDVMGYWRVAATRQPRSVDPGPIYRAGRAAGHSDDEIWASYDAARES